MRAVDKVKTKFTLADVLPSSLLEISQGDVSNKSLQEALGLSRDCHGHGPNETEKEDGKEDDINRTD